MLYNKDGDIMEDIKFFDKRVKTMEEIAELIQNSDIELKDIRPRDWMNKKSTASEILKLLIQVEDLFMDLDEYSLEHDFCFVELESIMLKLGDVREEFTDYVDKNKEILDLDL